MVPRIRSIVYLNGLDRLRRLNPKYESSQDLSKNTRIMRYFGIFKYFKDNFVILTFYSLELFVSVYKESIIKDNFFLTPCIIHLISNTLLYKLNFHLPLHLKKLFG